MSLYFPFDTFDPVSLLVTTHQVGSGGDAAAHTEYTLLSGATEFVLLMWSMEPYFWLVPPDRIGVKLPS